MANDNRTSFDKALASLRLYFDISAEIDFFDVLAAGTTPSEVRQTKLAAGSIKPDADDSLSYLFQSVQCAYFAHEIVDALNEVEQWYPSEEAAATNVEKSINVICESSKDIKFGKAVYEPWGDKPNPGFPKGTLNLDCDLSKYATSLNFKRDGKNILLEEAHPDGVISINQQPKKPSKDKPNLSAIVINSSLTIPNNRNTGGAALFLNHIPALEMSKCVPHFDLTISTPHPRFADGEKDKILNGISFSRFLMGNAKVEGGDEFFASAVDNRLRPNFIATASEDKKKRTLGQKDFIDNSARTSAVGMEAFTSPQTLVSGDEDWSSSGANRSAQVLDRFRPFLSIRNFKVDLVSNIGLIQSKTGTLTLVLHDRSRLSEISELVKVDMYGSTEILIEYGWNHPEPFNSENPWGQFLDSLKLMEKYQIASSSYSFDEVGQVTINLKLSLKGINDIEITKVGQSELSVSGMAALTELTEAIKAFKKRFPDFPEQSYKQPGYKKKQPSPGSKVVKARQLWKFNVNEFSDAKSFLALSDKQIKQMRDWINSSKGAKKEGAKDRAELKAIFEKFNVFGSSKDDNLISDIKKSISDVVSQKIATISHARYASLAQESSYGFDNGTSLLHKRYESIIKKRYISKDKIKPYGEQRHDPFFYKTNKHKKPSGRSNNIQSAPLNTNFGTLFLKFVARPLAASGKFDEVQVVFYTFNHFASYMRDVPISSFPINLNDFKQKYEERVKNGNAMLLQEFIGFINSEFVGNPHYRYGYGFGMLYEYDEKEKEFELAEEWQENSAGLNQARLDILEDAYMSDADRKQRAKDIKAGKPPWTSYPDLKFVQPSLSAAFEVLPSSTSESHTILRISIYDSANTGNDVMQDLMKGADSDSFEAMTRMWKGEENSEAMKDRKKRYVLQINQLLKEKLIKVQGAAAKDKITAADLGNDQLRFVVSAGVDAVKEACKARMPTITYGTSETNVISANVSSNAPPGLFEINLARANLGHGRTALGAKSANIPVEFAPITLSMKSMGYPFFYIGQEFFVEFNTGTTIDNIYRVSKVSHSVDQGTFNTDINFVPAHAYGQSKAITNIIADAVQLFETQE